MAKRPNSSTGLSNTRSVDRSKNCAEYPCTAAVPLEKIPSLKQPKISFLSMSALYLIINVLTNLACLERKKHIKSSPMA